MIERWCYAVAGGLLVLATWLVYRQVTGWMRTLTQKCPVCQAELKKSGFHMDYRGRNQVLVVCRNCQARYTVTQAGQPQKIG